MARTLNLLPLFLSSLLLLNCTTPTTSKAPASDSLPMASGPADKTIFAVYMVGSDLEDDLKPRNRKPDEQEQGKNVTTGSGSDDLREMIAGWKTLSEGAKSHLDVLVAFGGARKTGWQGVKYADMNCLQEDAKDDYFGNATCYVYADAQATMSNETELSHFLNHLQSNYTRHGRKVLQFWNHGLSYLGVGYDTTSAEDKDYVTLPEIRNALGQTQLHFDLINFDACLMASMEVANAVESHADYMIGSEELEPGHGWHYQDVLTSLAKGARQPLTEVGKQLVDSFMDHPDHQGPHSNFKTLSMLDLKALKPAIASVDSLASALGSLDHFEDILQAREASQHFGEEPRNDLDYAIDLKDWVSQLSERISEIQSPATQALTALDKLVLYSRHDDTKPRAQGISIYSLNANMKKNYGVSQSVSPNWLDFAGSFVTRGSSDENAPELSGESFGTQQAGPNNLCERNARSGHCLTIQDNLGLKAVSQVFALKADARYLYKIGSKRLGETQEHAYFAPLWNGEWFLLCDGDCRTGKSLFPPAYEVSESQTGGKIYASEAQLNGLDVVFYMEVGQNNAVSKHWAIPYELGAKGEVILAREQLQIHPGDRVQFFYQVYDVQSNKQTWQKGENLRFSGTPRFDFAKIEAPRTYFVQAEDYKGNLAVSDLYELVQ